jgi:hypothetical protein
MASQGIGRDSIIQALVGALEPLAYVLALWEGGAVAFGRVDRWSDIDVCVDAEDERVGDVFPVAEQALITVAPIELKYDVPEASTRGYVQAFYRLKDSPKTMLVDLAVFRHSEPNKLLEPEIHGRSRFHFNKQNAVTIPALDRAAFTERIKTRLGRLALRFDMFSCFVDKEIERGNLIEAVDLYHKMILGSLIEGLRMRYHAVHYDFGTRYIHYELPAGVVQELTDLHLVAGESDLVRKLARAKQWFRDTISGVEPDSLLPP